MKSILLALLITFVFATAADAQPQWEIHPFVGYAAGGRLETIKGDLKPADSAVFGLNLGIRIQEKLQFELGWAHQETHMQFDPIGGGDSVNAFDMGTNQLSAGINYAINQDKLTPFISFGLGATNWDPQGVDLGSEWEFMMVLGGGAKYYFGENFGVRAQMRIYSAFLNQRGGIFCDPVLGCYDNLQTGTVISTEFSAGLILGF